MKNILLWVIAAIVGYEIFLRPKKATPPVGSVGTATDSDLQLAFTDAKEKYGSETAADAEKIYRWETANFTSPLYKDSLSAGMNAFTDTHPYGWNSLKALWQNPDYRPTGVTEKKESGGKRLVVFPNVKAGIFSVCEVIKSRGGSGKWNSMDETAAASYKDYIDTMKNIYVV